MKFILFFVSFTAVLAAQAVPSGGDTPRSGKEPAPAVAAALKGVRLTTATTAVPPSGEGVDVSAIPWLGATELPAKLAAHLGRPLALTDIQEMAREIKAAAAGAGRPFVQVAVPPQEITSGNLTIAVIEGRVGQLKVQGAKWFSEASYRDALHLAPGQPIDQKQLSADLDWLGRSGYRRATVEVAPGEGVALTDLVMQVEEQRPWRFQTGYSDTGTATTDDERVMAGIQWGNAFGRAHELGYQLVASPDLRTSVTHSASYTLPLNAWRHVLRIDGAWSTIHPDLPAPFNSEGYSWQLGLNYEIPLRPVRVGRAGTASHSFTAALDVKETNNNVEFSSMPVTDNTTQIYQLRANYQASLEDACGGTSAGITVVFSPGGISSLNKDGAFAGSRAGGEARYAYLNLNLRRDTRLPHGFAHVSSVTAQWASTNLLGSEQLGLGGSNSVRGYDEGLLYGDEGVVLRNEIYLPEFSLVSRFAKKLPRDSLRLLGFWDYGWARSRHLLSGEDPNQILSSAGMGLRCQFGQHVSVRFDYGWQQSDPGFTTRETRGRGHVNATVSW